MSISTAAGLGITHNHTQRRQGLQGEKTQTQMGVSSGERVTFSFPGEEVSDGPFIKWDSSRHWDLRNLQAFPTGRPEEIARPGVKDSPTPRPTVVEYLAAGSEGIFPAAQTIDNFEVSIPEAAEGQTFRLTFANQADEFLIADLIVSGKRSLT